VEERTYMMYSWNHRDTGTKKMNLRANNVGRIWRGLESMARNVAPRESEMEPSKSLELEAIW
jgi:hypothetical protein